MSVVLFLVGCAFLSRGAEEAGLPFTVLPLDAAWQGAKIVIPRPMHVYDTLAVRIFPKKETVDHPLVGAIRRVLKGTN